MTVHSVWALKDSAAAFRAKDRLPVFKRSSQIDKPKYMKRIYACVTHNNKNLMPFRWAVSYNDICNFIRNKSDNNLTKFQIPTSFEGCTVGYMFGQSMASGSK